MLAYYTQSYIHLEPFYLKSTPNVPKTTTRIRRIREYHEGAGVSSTSPSSHEQSLRRAVEIVCQNEHATARPVLFHSVEAQDIPPRQCDTGVPLTLLGDRHASRSGLPTRQGRDGYGYEQPTSSVAGCAVRSGRRRVCRECAQCRGESQSLSLVI